LKFEIQFGDSLNTALREGHNSIIRSLTEEYEYFVERLFGMLLYGSHPTPQYCLGKVSRSSLQNVAID
jgi:hypothetical protein